MTANCYVIFSLGSIVHEYLFLLVYKWGMIKNKNV